MLCKSYIYIYLDRVVSFPGTLKRCDLWKGVFISHFPGTNSLSLGWWFEWDHCLTMKFGHSCGSPKFLEPQQKICINRSYYRLKRQETRNKQRRETEIKIQALELLQPTDWRAVVLKSAMMVAFLFKIVDFHCAISPEIRLKCDIFHQGE